MVVCKTSVNVYLSLHCQRIIPRAYHSAYLWNKFTCSLYILLLVYLLNVVTHT